MATIIMATIKINPSATRGAFIHEMSCDAHDILIECLKLQYNQGISPSSLNTIYFLNKFFTLFRFGYSFQSGKMVSW
jgi:hypothetical protein